jgi:hypothetical protein
MEVRAFLVLDVPFIIVAYLAVLLFLHPPYRVLFSSLAGGLFMGVVNVLVDLAAYYAHWWHYNLSELILHLPLPFYISDVLIYGSIAYLLIWHFWKRRGHWFAMLLLIGIPIFGIVRDIFGALTRTSYTVWDSTLPALLATILLWVVMFYGGYWFFTRLAPTRDSLEITQSQEIEADEHDMPEMQNHTDAINS